MLVLGALHFHWSFQSPFSGWGLGKWGPLDMEKSILGQTEVACVIVADSIIFHFSGSSVGACCGTKLDHSHTMVKAKGRKI